MNNLNIPIQASELEASIRSGIPISAHMDFRVRELSAQNITVSGGATENINVHQTAFAGSLYAICTLAAWGLTYSKLPDNCSLVMEKASIEYLRPVRGQIVAEAVISQEQSQGLLEQLAQSAKARLELQVVVMNERKIAVKFTAYLYVKMNG